MDYNNLCYGCMEERGPDKTCPHCALPADAGPESALHLPPGTVLQDKYLLGRALGQGGFGITYLAWDKILKIKLAIKEYLPQQLAYRTDGSTKVSVYKQSLTEEFSYGREKFLEEAQTLARFIEHPNVVSVRDYFEANGTAYLVMHYHEGITLQNYLAGRSGKIPVEQALSIIMPVLDALGEVHRSGFMHRDISPDNILITGSGQVILIDFGAARQEVRDKSKSLSVILKAGYAPEEQYRSRGKQGPWTDIYAVGATLYRAITGETPPEAMDRLDEDDLVPPSKLGVVIDPQQEQALLRALAVKARNRYQAVEEFQAVLVAAGDKGRVGEGYAGVRPKKPAEPAKVPEKEPEPAERPAEPGKAPVKAEVKAGEVGLKEKVQADIQAEAVKEPEKKPEPAEKPAGWATQVAPAYSISKKTFKTAALVVFCAILLIGSISLFRNGEEIADSAVPATEEEAQGAVDVNDEGVGMEEPAQTYDPAIIADLDADYYIDYENGTIPLGDLPIGARVVDPGWEWEYRLGLNYSDEDWVLQKEEEIYRITKTGQSTPPGEVKPVTWLVVARDHYDLDEGHVTLLAAELIGFFAFDDSTDHDHEDAEYGYNHWGESGTGNAGHGLRPWLNSTGIHSGEGFYQVFSESFKSAVLTTTLPNKEWQNGSAYSTQDKVFIPSTTELGDTEHDRTYQIGDFYTFFSGAGDEERVAMMGGDGWSEIVEKLPEEYRERWGVYGNKWFYWTRSPHSDYGYGVRGVGTTGAFYDLYAYGDGTGVRPALNLKSEILLSEINP